MINSQEIIASTEEKVRTSEMYIQAFNAFSEAFEPILNTIYYPGSNIDISPSKTASFQNHRIIYVDRDKKAIQTLQKEGCEAYAEDAENFNPGGVNLLLLLNFYAEETLRINSQTPSPGARNMANLFVFRKSKPSIPSFQS